MVQNGLAHLREEYMSQAQDPQEIRTAPSGMVRLVHEDARDHWPTREGDFPDLASAQTHVARGWAPRVREFAAYDDQGNRLLL